MRRKNKSTLPPEIEARQKLTTGLLQWLLSLESGEPWNERLLTAQPMASGQVRYLLTERRADAAYLKTDMLDESIAELVRMLQQYMYTPTGGAWVTAELSVTTEGKGDARFNYDDEPQLPGPDGVAASSMPAEEIARHLQTYPRPANATPEWMRAG
jgi:hypothetical protein